MQQARKAEGSETEAQDVTKNYSIILLAGLLKVTDGSEEDPVDPGQVVTKTHEDKTYDLDETVTFTINVKNIYDEAKTVRIIELPGVVIEGAPQETPNVLTVEKVPAGETVTATATYKITEADIANGSFVNTVKVEFEGGKPFENTDTVTTVDPVRSYTLTKKSSESISRKRNVQSRRNHPLHPHRDQHRKPDSGKCRDHRYSECSRNDFQHPGRRQ